MAEKTVALYLRVSTKHQDTPEGSALGVFITFPNSIHNDFEEPILINNNEWEIVN